MNLDVSISAGKVGAEGNQGLLKEVPLEIITHHSDTRHVSDRDYATERDQVKGVAQLVRI
jgi:hypothetical protein